MIIKKMKNNENQENKKTKKKVKNQYKKSNTQIIKSKTKIS